MNDENPDGVETAETRPLEGTAETFSYTRLSCFDQCPRQYHFKYVEKTPEAFVSVEAYLGQVIHQVLAWLYEVRMTGAVPPEADVLARFDEAWTAGLTPRVRVIRRNDTLEARRDAGRGLLQRYYRGPLQRDRLRTLALEKSFTLPLPNGHRYKGIFDRLAVDAKERIHIVDYKTTGRVPLRLDDALAFQLRSYAFLYLSATDATEVRLWYHYLHTSKTLGEAITEADVAAVADGLVARIGAVLGATAFEPSPCALCAWCGYRDICDASGYAPAAPGAPLLCPRCGKRLRVKRGRHGEFLSCEGFPRCRYSRDA